MENPEQVTAEQQNTITPAATPFLARLHYWRIPLVILCIGAFLTLGTLSLLQKNNTWDEISHLASGYLYILGDTLKNDEHPMFSKAIVCLPLRWWKKELRSPQSFPSFKQGTRNRYWRLSSDILYHNRMGADRLLNTVRLTALLLWGLVLGVVIYAFSTSLYGWKSGLLSLLLAMFSPNLLAHARLVTTDFPVSVFMVATVFCFWLCLQRFSWVRAVGCGLFGGMAVCTKVSGVLLLPILILLGTVWVLLPAPTPPTWPQSLKQIAALVEKRSSRVKRLAQLMTLFMIMSLVAWGLIWGTYGFRFLAGQPGQRYMEELPIQPPRNGPNVPYRCARFAADYHLLPSHFLYAYSRVNIHNERGHRTFLAGKNKSRGTWSFFPLAIAVKTPIPTLLLLAAALLGFLYDLYRRSWSRCRQDVFILTPPLFFLLFAMSSNLNIGLRHILPIYPFLFIFIGRLLAETSGGKKTKKVLVGGPTAAFWRQQSSRIALGICCLWMVADNLWIYPDYLTFFNAFAGGPDHGLAYLADSNLDWGQDLKRLKVYMDREGIREVKLSYFGTARPEYYGIRYRYLPSSMIMDPQNPVRKLEWRGVYAISATMLTGSYLMPGQKNFGEFLQVLQQRYQPTARIGHSIYIYRFDK